MTEKLEIVEMRDQERMAELGSREEMVGMERN